MAEAINTYQEPQPENKEHVQEMLLTKNVNQMKTVQIGYQKNSSPQKIWQKPTQNLRVSWGNRMKKKTNEAFEDTEYSRQQTKSLNY